MSTAAAKRKREFVLRKNFEPIERNVGTMNNPGCPSAARTEVRSFRTGPKAEAPSPAGDAPHGPGPSRRNLGAFRLGVCFALCLLLPGTFSAPAQARSSRIIGGERARADAWPWAVAIVRAGGTDPRLSHFCGGALVHPRWVATAAHCADGDLPEELAVLAGSNRLTDPETAEVAIRRIVIQPNYRFWSGDDHDIALLELAEPLFLEQIAPVPESLAIEGLTGVVVGWGVTSEDASATPDELQEVSLPIVANEECNAAFNAYSWSYDDPVTANMICAGPMEGGRDACYGDSGGPLMVFHNGAWRLAGIVSWGEGCAEPGLFGVYTRVSSYLDFLRRWVPIPGDITADGGLGLPDAEAILQTVAGLRSPGEELPYPGDFDLDTEVTLKDAVEVLRILVD